MKSLFLLSAFLLMPLVAPAQEATLLSGDIDHSGYGSLVSKVAPINGQAALMLGIEGVWTINHQVYVGVSGAGIVNPVDANTLQLSGKPYLLWLNETGVRGGYIFGSNDLIHYTAGAFVGAGSMQLADRYPWNDPSRVRTHSDETYYFIVEPEVGAELNIATWMRAKVGAGYRIVSGAEEQGMTNAELSGPVGSLTLSFGSF